MSFQRIILFMVLFVSVTAFAGWRNMQGQVLVFNNSDQELLVMDVESKKMKGSFKILEKTRNPMIIIGANKQIVSLSESFGESEHIVDLSTGKVVHSVGTIGTVAISKNKKFYFEISDPGNKQLFYDDGYNKKKLVAIKSLKVPYGRVIGGEVASWFVRSEHRLISFDLEGNSLNSVSLDCRDALFLGEGKNIFCLMESGGAAIVDENGAVLEAIKGVGLKYSILSYSPEYGLVFLSKISLSFSMKSFMKEVVDVYSYSLDDGSLTLIKESVVGHGVGFNII